jgi:hypothetical protein
MKNIKAKSIGELRHVATVLRQVSVEEYTLPHQALNGSSIGQHVRHILEFWETLVNKGSLIISYDKRERKLILEDNPLVALDLVVKIEKWLNSIDTDHKVIVTTVISDTMYEMTSSLLREIHYNLEHTTHHLAMLTAFINSCYPKIKLDSNVGIAYSTLQHKQIACQFKVQ